MSSMDRSWKTAEKGDRQIQQRNEYTEWAGEKQGVNANHEPRRTNLLQLDLQSRVFCPTYRHVVFVSVALLRDP
jgi:hypothetical protein